MLRIVNNLKSSKYLFTFTTMTTTNALVRAVSLIHFIHNFTQICPAGRFWFFTPTVISIHRGGSLLFVWYNQNEWNCNDVLKPHKELKCALKTSKNLLHFNFKIKQKQNKNTESQLCRPLAQCKLIRVILMLFRPFSLILFQHSSRCDTKLKWQIVGGIPAAKPKSFD